MWQYYALQSASAIYNGNTRTDVVSLVYVQSNTVPSAQTTVVISASSTGSPFDAPLTVNGTVVQTPYNFTINFSWGLQSSDESRILNDLKSFGIVVPTNFTISGQQYVLTSISSSPSVVAGTSFEIIDLVYSATSPSTTPSTQPDTSPSNQTTNPATPSVNVASFALLVLVLGGVVAVGALAIINIRKRRAIAPIPSLRTVLKVLDIRRRRSAIAILGGVLYLVLYVFPEFLPVVGGHLPNDPYEVGLIITTFVIFVLTTHLLYASIQGSRLSPSRAKSTVVRVVSAGLAVVLTIALFFSGLGISGAFLGDQEMMREFKLCFQVNALKTERIVCHGAVSQVLLIEQVKPLVVPTDHFWVSE